MTDRIILKGSSKLLMPVITQVMAVHQLLEQKDIGTIYADISQTNTVYRKHKPKLVLYFREDSDFVPTGTQSTTPHGRDRKDSIISFRLMDETSQTFSEANGTALGQKIKEVFGADGGFIWNKGKTLYSYTDWEKGYQLQLLCRNEVEAKRVTTAALSIKNDTPDWRNLQEVKNDQEALRYPVNPGTQVIMGKTVNKPVERPTVDVRFQYAYVKLSGVKEPVTLYDRRRKRTGALVE